MSRPLAPFGRRALLVTANETHGAYTVLRAADPRGPAPAPGQFYMLSTERWGGGEDGRPYLPRAFSVLRHEPEELHFMLEDVGPGTHRLCALHPGEALHVLGPLGNGFTLPTRPAILVGGGVGTAPLAILQDVLRDSEGCTVPPESGRRHTQPRVLLGFRDEAHAAGAELLASPQVATDDGSVGHHGRVTDLLAAALREEPGAEVFSCGPPPMLEAVRSLCAERDVPVQLALEAGMACGYGACFGCAVTTRQGLIRLCLDGPVLTGLQLERVHEH